VGRDASKCANFEGFDDGHRLGLLRHQDSPRSLGDNDPPCIKPAAGETSVRLARPIDLAFSGWAARELEGWAADGRRVRLSIVPTSDTAAPIDVAIAVDHSGSMGEQCAMDGAYVTKHQAAAATLSKVAGQLSTGDHVDLWEFNTTVSRIGSTGGAEAGNRIETADRLRELITGLNASR
jgi:hypothetical protein